MRAQKRAKPVKFGNEDQSVKTPDAPIQTSQSPQPAQPAQPLQILQDPLPQNSLAEVPQTPIATDSPEEEIKETQNPEPTSVSKLDNTQETPEKANDDDGHKFIYFIVVALIAFLVGLISMTGINSFLQNRQISFLNTKKIASTPAPVITSTPTPEKKFNLAEYRIEILNGSGVTGAAAKLKDSLIHEGFNVISAGNADRSDYTYTIISAKKEVASAYLNKLKVSLNTYSVQDAKTPVSSGNEADVIITIGSKTKMQCQQDKDCAGSEKCMAEGPVIAGQPPQKVCVPQGEAVPL